MAKKKKDVKIQKSEVLYYRMLIVLAALIAVIFSITYLTRTAEDYNSFVLNISPILALVFAVLCIPAIVFYAICRKNGKDGSHKVLSSGYILTLVAWLTSIFALYGRISSMTVMVYIVVTAALYFIYYLFDREFFFYSFYAAVGAAVLMAMKSSTRAEHLVFSVVAVALSTLAPLIAVRDRKKPLEIKLGKSTFQLIDGGYKAYPFLVSAAILLLGTLLSFFFADAEFYSLIVLFACYLVFTIVNTVKMM